MAEDFYGYVASQQLAKLDAAKAQHLADLANAKANSDYDSAASSVQEIANIEAAKQNLVALHEQYIQSQQAPVQPELTREERDARPWQRMTPEDGLEVARGSKYGKDLSFNDPNVIAGFYEAARRRNRGE